jgi:PAS domain S-box-containing protein
MEDKEKTKQQLIQELNELRRSNLELKHSESERKKLEEALQESRNIKRALLNAPSDVILLLDLDGCIIDANETAARRIGMPLDQLIGVCIWDLLPPDIARSRKAHGDQLVLSGEPVRFEDERDGLWFDNVVYPISNEEGRAARIAVVSRDITERKQMEEALRRSELELRLITDNIRDTVWVMDLNFNTLWISPSVFRNRGYTFEEICSTPLENHITPASHDKARQALSELAASDRWTDPEAEISTSLELEFYRKDGSTFWSDTEAILLRNPAGKPTGLLCVGRDITDRKRAKEALKQSEERFRVIFENNAAAIAIIEQDTTFSMANEAHCRLTGFTKEEIIGKSWRELVTPEGLERMNEYRRQRLLNPQGGPGQYEFTFYDKNGKVKHAFMSVSMIPSTRQIIISTIDITESKEAQESLNKSREQLRLLSTRLMNAQEKERTRIAYELHDELGQSLVGLKFQLTGLQKKLKGRKSGASQEITQALETINGMSDDIRRISQELRPSILEHLGLMEALDWLLEDFSKKSRITIVKKMDKIKQKFSKQQEIMIFRIFQEALTNIGKHSEATQVTVAISEDKKSAFFAIRDNGKGFSQKEVEERSPLKIGNGLIAMKERSIMARGELRIDSLPGEGTAITFEIPKKQAKTVPLIP